MKYEIQKYTVLYLLSGEISQGVEVFIVYNNGAFQIKTKSSRCTSNQKWQIASCCTSLNRVT